MSKGNRIDPPFTVSRLERSITPFGWGVNSTVNAPQLKTFQNGALSLKLGRNLNIDLLTNIFASRFSVAGSKTLLLQEPVKLAPPVTSVVTASGGAGVVGVEIGAGRSVREFNAERIQIRLRPGR